jgi:predicted sulfurtransferase
MNHGPSCILLISVAIFFAACSSTDTSTQQKPVNTPVASTPKTSVPKDGVRRITVAELEALVGKGEVYIVDVRSDTQYKRGHIKGAHLIPTDQILQRADELPRDKTIVTYCS